MEHSQGPSAEDIQEILPLLSPKQLADAIWGFAKKGAQPTDEFMAVVAQEVHSKLDQFRWEREQEHVGLAALGQQGMARGVVDAWPTRLGGDVSWTGL